MLEVMILLILFLPNLFKENSNASKYLLRKYITGMMKLCNVRAKDVFSEMF